MKFDKARRVVPTIALVVSLALGTVACQSSNDKPSNYDPNMDQESQTQTNTPLS